MSNQIQSLLSLPQLQKGEARALSSLSAYGSSISIPPDEQRMCHFSLGRKFRQKPEFTQSVYSIIFSYMGQKWELLLSSELLVSFLQSFVQDEDVKVLELPEAILSAVIDAACHHIVKTLEELHKGSPTIESVQEVRAPREASCQAWIDVECVHQGDQSLSFAWIGTTLKGLELLAALLEKRQKKSENFSVQNLPIPLYFVLGRTITSYQEIKKWRLRDVILIKESFLEDNNLLFVFLSSRLGFQVKWEGTQCIVCSPINIVIAEGIGMSKDNAWDDEVLEKEKKLDSHAGSSATSKATPVQASAHTAEDDEDDDDDDDDYDDEDDEDDDYDYDDDEEAEYEDDDEVDGADAPSTSDIPITLTFDIGRREMTIKELKSLRTGFTFDIGRPLSQCVSIRANGRLIGEGDLVDIEGKLGVILTHLNR